MHQDRLLQLADRLRSGEIEADRFDMSVYIRVKYDENRGFLSKLFFGTSSCNTTACIAGEAVIEFTDMSAEELTLSVYEVAMDVLDLNEKEMDKIAYLSRWPYSLTRSYANANTREERREIAADRIEYFVEEKK